MNTFFIRTARILSCITLPFGTLWLNLHYVFFPEQSLLASWQTPILILAPILIIILLHSTELVQPANNAPLTSNRDEFITRCLAIKAIKRKRFAHDVTMIGLLMIIGFLLFGIGEFCGYIIMKAELHLP